MVRLTDEPNTGKHEEDTYYLNQIGGFLKIKNG